MLLTFANTSCVCLIEKSKLCTRIGTNALFEYDHEVKGTKETIEFFSYVFFLTINDHLIFFLKEQTKLPGRLPI